MYSCDHPDLLDSGAYLTISENLSKFSNFENLDLHYKSGHRLSYFDSLIDDCKHLKILNISLQIWGVEEDILQPGQLIHPRPGIHLLHCKWEMIGTEDRLNYIILKFPNLKTLRVDFEEYDYNYIHQASPDVLLKFLHFCCKYKRA